MKFFNFYSQLYSQHVIIILVGNKSWVTLKYLMGHTDISVTLNVYTYLKLEDAEKEIKRLENVEKELKRRAR